MSPRPSPHHQPAEPLRRRYFHAAEHPYSVLERIAVSLAPPAASLLDAGCGRSAERLARLVEICGAARGVGIDLVEFTPAALADPRLELHRADLAAIPVAGASIDLICSVSVMEHLVAPEAVYAEMFRLLRPGGHFLCLTPNLWDYVSLISKLIPNRFHPMIVARAEGRAEQDTFPAYYRSNTRRSIRRLAAGAGFEIRQFRYLGQYPSYFLFSRTLFLLGTAYQKSIERFAFTQWLQGWILACFYKPDAVLRMRNAE